MRATEFITEGMSHPVICVDVQPEYNGGPWPPANAKFVQIMNFVQKQTGPVLFFVNAEDQGLSGDSIQQIQQFWDETLGTEGEEGEDENGEYYYNEPESPIDWRRFEIVDKGYGYLRSWMDHGIEPSTIIATIREMYTQKVSDTRDLEFPSFNKRTTTQSLIMGAIEEMEDDPMTVGWASIAQLKRFNGAYLVGGGRDECLREVELLMNAFNIKYKRIDSLVYQMRATEFIGELIDNHPDHQFKTAYHITSTENAEEILYAGLDPYDGKAFMVVDEGDKSKLRKELSVVADWMYAKSEGSDDPLTLLQIDVTNLPLAYEHGWYFSTTNISPDRIQDLGENELARYV